MSENLENGPQGAGVQADHAYTLEARNKVQAVAFAENTRNELRLVDGDGGIAPSLQTQGGKAGRGYPAVAQRAPAALAFNARQDPDVFDGHTGPLDTDGCPQGIAHAPDASGHPKAQQAWRVRRLMPVECERLQGFPDGYTLIPGVAKGGWRDVDETEDVDELRALGMPVRLAGNTWRVKDPDGPRYKALGNSMAVNVMRWIGRRIEMVEAITRPVAGGQPKGRQQ